MTTQTATILVTDLVDSTALRARVGEERADELRRQHDRLLSEVAEGNGGTVVKGLGDGLLVSFAGAAEAVDAAVVMQQAVDTLGRREEEDLSIRIGLSAGDVSFEEGDSFGTPVVEAARLCAAAAGGQIVVADVVRVLARGRGGHEVSPLGALELKGLPEPVEAHLVGWTPVRSTAELRAQSPYVGREAERAELRARLASAAAGRGGLVLVAGEPGIGKTRLVSEVCREAGDGVVVLMGGCHDGEVTAGAPFVEALTDWIRRTTADEARTVLGPEAPILARLVPGIRTTLPEVEEPLPVPAEQETHRLHDALSQVLFRLGEARAVVLVLDDLHWADPATVGMLRALARRAAGHPLLVVGTYRDTDLDRTHPLAEAIPDLRREAEPTRISLDGLTSEAVHELLRRLADHEVSEAFAELLTRHTDGNPFFLREMLLHLTAEGKLRFEDGSWVADDDVAVSIPEGVREVVGRRLSQLSADANALLGVGALFDVAFPLAVAADVAGLAEDDALDAVDEALAARIVQPGDRFDHYGFTHALFRQTLLAEQNPSRQVRSHRAIAEALEKRLDGEPTADEAASLARHWHLSAAIPGAERGVPYAMTSAADAASRFAHREAYEAWLMAAELLAPGDEREVEVHEALAAAAVLGEVSDDETVAVFERTGEVLARTRGADAAADFLAEHVHQATLMDRTWLAWRILDVARRWLDPERRDSTWVLLRNVELSREEFEDPRYQGILVDSPERRELVEVAVRCGFEVWPGLTFSPPTRADGLELFRQATRLEERRTFSMLPWAAGEYVSMLPRARQMAEDGRQAKNPTAVVLACALWSRVAAILGEHDEADAALAEGFTLLDRVSPTGNASFQLLAAVPLISRGRGHPMTVTDVAGLSQFSDQPGTRWALLPVTGANAYANARSGDTGAAMADLESVLPGVDAAPGWAPNYPFLVCMLASTLWEVGRVDHLDVVERNLRDKVLEPDLRYPEVDSRWAMALLCGLTDRVEEARQFFDRAHETLAEGHLETVRVNVAYDEATFERRLGSDGDPERFAAALTTARERCTHPAMAPWLPRLDALEAG